MRMTKILYGIMAVAATVGSLLLSCLNVVPLYATDCVTNPTGSGCPCASSSGSAACSEMNPDSGKSNTMNTVKNLINTTLMIIGALSVAMIIFSGIRYVTAHGDKAQIQSAKNTLVYSVVGLVVALLSYAIIGFVLNTISGVS